MQQVLVIGGGTSFSSYRSYISFLKEKEIDLDGLKPHDDWKDNLQQKLGKNYEVIFPRMPNKTNARYKEWKIWFERVSALLNKRVILVGHSLGGVFLAKYLSENRFPKTVMATVLVAAPFDKRSLVDFKLKPSLTKFATQSELIYLVHSKDDPVVEFEDLGKFQRLLPNAKTMVFNDRGHFNQESFPELVKLIKSYK